MRWGNYYLTADTRISLREENVVLWENILNSSLQVPPLGFTDSRKMGGGFSSVLREGGGGGSPFCTMSPPPPGFSVGGMVQNRDKTGMRGCEGKGSSGEWSTGVSCARLQQQERYREPEAACKLLRDTGAAQRSLWILSPGTHMSTRAGQGIFF